MATPKPTYQYLPDIIRSCELPGITDQLRDSRQILVIEDDGLRFQEIAVILHPDEFKALRAAALAG